MEPGTAFEDLPDDWVCPICQAEKEEFSSVVGELKEKVEKQEEIVKQLFGMIEQLGEAPVAEPTNAKKAPSSTSFKDHLNKAKELNLV